MIDKARKLAKIFKKNNIRKNQSRYLMDGKELVRRDRIIDYLDNIEKQMEDIKSIPVSGKDFFFDKKNSIQIKAI